MKIILSRKGFDSSAGGVPSPIFEDGSILSLPIPDDRSSIKYEEIVYPGLCFWSLVEQLTNGEIKRTHGAHLDPDIRRSAYVDRHPLWKGVFGQIGASQSHLASQVSRGDLFLFFGWFRRVENRTGIYRYVHDAPDLHMFFGWLQIERIIMASSEDRPHWIGYHPHCHDRFITNPSGANNCLYIATDRLTIDGNLMDLPGYGSFQRIDDSLCLTCSNQSKRSLWYLPSWFYPFDSGRTPLSYHGDPTRWVLADNGCVLKSVWRGQEFILNADEYPEATKWAVSLIEAGGVR